MSGIAEYLVGKLKKLEIAIATPQAFKARGQGCYFETYEMVYTLRRMGIIPCTILDIGANVGVFTKTAHFVFPESDIHAFEPLGECYDELCRLKNQIANLTCHNIALGAESKETIIHHNAYHYSSSLLEMEDTHKEMFPFTSRETPETVRVEKLDSVLEATSIRRPILIKIDVQGFEKQVLEGARKTLEYIDYMICELSFVELYRGQPLFREMYHYLDELGFKFKGQVGELRDPKSNQILQIDALFTK